LWPGNNDINAYDKSPAANSTGLFALSVFLCDAKQNGYSPAAIFLQHAEYHYLFIIFAFQQD
jgi:hypothetical protein